MKFESIPQPPLEDMLEMAEIRSRIKEGRFRAMIIALEHVESFCDNPLGLELIKAARIYMGADHMDPEDLQRVSQVLQDAFCPALLELETGIAHLQDRQRERED